MSLENYPSFLLNLSRCEMNGEEKHFYRFMSYRLYVEERQLLNNGKSVALTPKAFDVLAALVERNGRLVEKDELLRIVWADSFVEEANVARIVHTLRKILGEDENGNKFIETVAKKGYRFVAEVNEVREPTAQKSADSKEDFSSIAENLTEATTAEKSFEDEFQISSSLTEIDEAAAPLSKNPIHTTRIVLFTIGFLSAVFLIFLLSFNFQPNSSDNPNKVKSIAILPFKPINTANRDEIYEVGIADSLILKLGSLKELVVRPLSATRKYADVGQDALAAGREQQVDYILASNYQLANGKIRVTAQLFNVNNGQIEETYKSEKDAGDLFNMQDAIAGEIGNLLSRRFATASGNSKIAPGTTNEEAYRLYLQGRNLTHNRAVEHTRKAVEYFEQAIKLDPNFALAYSGMAHAFIASGNLGGDLPPVEFEKARTAVTRALELDNNLAEAYAVSGELKFNYEWDFAAAEKDLLRAIELEPNSDLAHKEYAWYLAAMGRFNEAIAEAKTSQEINPGSIAVQQNFGRILYLARRYDEAIIQFKQIVEAKGGSSEVYYGYLWLVNEMKGDTAQAYKWFMEYQKQNFPENVQLYQKAYETLGWHGVRQKFFTVQKLNEHKPSANLYAMARQCALLGEKKQAFEYLNKAIEKRQGQLVQLNVEPSFDILHDDPLFEEMVRRLGFN